MSPRIRFAGLGIFLLTGILRGQETPPAAVPLEPFVPVRKALPVQPDVMPVRKAVPVPAITPSPTPTITPTPAPAPTPPAPETPAPAPEPTAARSADQILLDYANGLYARNLHDMAAPEYERFLNLYPVSRDRQLVMFRLGECYRATGNLNNAKLAYENLLASYGTGDCVGPAAFRVADLYYQDKNYQSALSFFRRAAVLLKDPNIVAYARFYTGRCLEMLGRSPEARAAYEDVILDNNAPAIVEASRLSLAQLLGAASMKKEAVQQLDALAKEAAKPEVRAEALVKAGLTRIDLKDFQRARADLEAALGIPEIGPMKEAAQIGILKILFETQKYPEFLEQYPALAETLSAEARPEILMLAANAHRQLTQNQQARDVYERVSKEFPGTPYDTQARFELLLALYNSGDAGLLAAADAFLAQNPAPEKRDQVQLLKAETLFKKEDYSGALPLYEGLQGSGLLPRLKTEALFKLAWCYQKIQQPENAIAGFTRFLTDSPNHQLAVSALAQRAVAYQQLKNLPAALKDFELILQRFPSAQEREVALQQKALILGQLEDDKGMARTFRQLLEEFPKSAVAAQANYWIGRAAFKAKEYKDSLAPLEEARKLDSEQFLEPATLRIMLAHYYLEQRQELAAEVDLYSKGKGKVPALLLRWLSGEFYKAGQFQQAEEYLAPLTSRPEEMTADDWLNLGRSQSGQGAFAKGIGSLERYLTLVKEPFPRATGLLALAEAQLGERLLEAAEQSAEQACTLQPEGELNARGRILLGDIAAGGGDFPKAARVYMGVSVVFDDPKVTPAALEKAARAYQKAGQPEQAAKVINTLQSRYPEYPFRP